MRLSTQRFANGSFLYTEKSVYRRYELPDNELALTISISAHFLGGKSGSNMNSFNVVENNPSMPLSSSMDSRHGLKMARVHLL